VGPAAADAPKGQAALDARLRAALATGESLRDAAALVATTTGLPRKQVCTARWNCARAKRNSSLHPSPGRAVTGTAAEHNLCRPIAVPSNSWPASAMPRGASST
jgi:hypothetical protein